MVYAANPEICSGRAISTKSQMQNQNRVLRVLHKHGMKTHTALRLKSLKSRGDNSNRGGGGSKKRVING